MLLQYCTTDMKTLMLLSSLKQATNYTDKDRVGLLRILIMRKYKLGFALKKAQIKTFVIQQKFTYSNNNRNSNNNNNNKQLQF